MFSPRLSFLKNSRLSLVNTPLPPERHILGWRTNVPLTTAGSSRGGCRGAGAGCPLGCGLWTLLWPLKCQTPFFCPEHPDAPFPNGPASVSSWLKGGAGGVCPRWPLGGSKNHVPFVPAFCFRRCPSFGVLRVSTRGHTHDRDCVAANTAFLFWLSSETPALYGHLPGGDLRDPCHPVSWSLIRPLACLLKVT